MSVGLSFFDGVVLLVKVIFLTLFLLPIVPTMVWVERRGSALMQNRLGPNRVGPLGILQSLADVVKMMFKEDPVPGHVEARFYVLAPLIAIIPAFMTFAVLPFAGPMAWQGHWLRFQVADQLDIGVLYCFAIASLGVYGVMMAGWASNNKYALMGSLRSSSQMISYELAMGLAVAAVVVLYASLKPEEMVAAQAAPLLQWGSWVLPRWGIFLQPVGFLIFLITAFAETNRLPFDLPEGESELVAGYHIEYGSMKFALFMMSEYLNMTTASGLLTTFYFGGWQLLPGQQSTLSLLQHLLGLSATASDVLRVLFQMSAFTTKLAFFMWFFVWVRWTLPRFRYDQLMALGWKTLLPLSFVNLLVTFWLAYEGWV